MQKPPFELHILGHTELTGPVPEAGESVVRQSKRLALLAYLALTTADGFRRRDRVVAFFWPELDQAQARTYLRKSLYAIREALGEDVFTTRGEDELRIDHARLWCDAVALAQHVRDGNWSDALALYRGELLEGLFPEGVAQEFQEWLSEQRNTLRQLAARAAWECSRLEEERGDRTAAAVMARRARELDPDNEEGVRRLMGLLDRRGDRGGALRVYAEWQARLLEEFGVEPDPETRKLARKVQAARKGESHETAPVLMPVATWTPPSGVVPAPGESAAHGPLSRHSVPNARQPWRAAAIGIATLLVVVLAGALWSRVASITPQGGPRSLAVLPLRPIGDSALQQVAEAIAEELTSALAEDTTVTVRSATRAHELIRVGGDVDQIGQRLGTRFVVDGVVQRGAGKLRVTLRLLRTIDAVAVWAGHYDVADGETVSIARRVAADAAPPIITRLTATR